MSMRFKTICPTCGRGMDAGRRCTIAFGWELSASSGEHVRKATIVCRRCAETIAMATGIDIPEAVSGQ